MGQFWSIRRRRPRENVSESRYRYEERLSFSSLRRESRYRDEERLSFNFLPGEPRYTDEERLSFNPLRKDRFERFMTSLPFFLTKNVTTDLTSYFEFSKTEVDELNNDHKNICFILRQRKIISAYSITPLVNALRKTNNDRIVPIVETTFSFFIDRGFASSTTTAEMEDYSQRFLKSLSFLLNTNVIKDLSSLFELSDAEVDTFSSDSAAFCKRLGEVGIISPRYIKPLIFALHVSNNEKIAEVVEEMFRLFQYARLSSPCASQQMEDYFQRFLKSLSFLLNKKVVKDLSSLFKFSDADVHTFSSDSVTFCKMLREVGIVHPDYITPLILALNSSSNKKIGEIVKDLFSLFQDEKFDSPCASEHKEDYFQRFLRSLSFLLNKKVVNDLSSLFKFSDVDVDTFNNDSVLFCKMLREVGIVHPDYITPMVLALNASSNEKIGKIVDDLFRLFQAGKFDSPCASKKEEDVFNRLLYCVSRLMPVPVEKEMLSVFAYSDAEVQRINYDSRELITILRERGIINQMYTHHLHLALCDINPTMVLIKAIMKEFESLFHSGKLNSSNLWTEVSDDNFERFIERLSLQINEDIKKRLVGLLSLSDVDVETAGNDNLSFCRHLAQRGLISPTYVTPLIIAIKEKPIRRIVENLFREYQDATLTHLIVSKSPQAEDFQRFLDILSLLITEDIEKLLADSFNVSDIKLRSAKHLDMSVCHLLAQEGVICHANIDKLKGALQKQSKYKLAEGVEELFILFQCGKLIPLPTSEVIDDDVFDELLDCLSSLMSDDVKQALASFFKLSPAALEAVGNDKKAFCVFLKEQGIIDRAYITPLTNALYKEKLFRVSQCASIHFDTYRRKTHSCTADQQKSIGRTTCGEDVEQSKEGLSENPIQVPVDTSRVLSLDFCQYQTTNAGDNDDSAEEDDEHFFRAAGLKCLEVSASISKEGGYISIPNTEVELQIQPNSFLRDDEIHLITLQILPRRLFDKPSSCFEDHSTVMVEILPNNLKLQRAARLTLPHCLILRNPPNCDVQIFHSHHDPDQLPHWEDISKSVQHELSTKVCHIWIENFSWIKYDIGGNETEGKKLFLYTLGKKYTRNSKFVTAEVGYFPALPGNDRIKLKDVDFITSSKGTRFESKLRKMFQGDWQTFVFWKEPKTSLAISVSEINPRDGWKSTFTCPKYISYQDVEISNEQSQPFTFERQKDEAPFPVIHFKVCQGEKYSEIYVDMEEGLIQDELQVSPNHQQIQDEKQIQPMFQENEKCAKTFGNKEVNLSKAISPVNAEAIQVRETAVVLSPSNGGLVVRDELREQITFQQQNFPGCFQEVSNHLQGCPPISQLSAPLQMNNSGKLMPIFMELSTNDVINLARLLDISNPLMRDWRMLAGNLGFTDVDVENLARQSSPTRAVIHCASQSGTLKSKDHLIKILEDMERIDAKKAIL